MTSRNEVPSGARKLHTNGSIAGGSIHPCNWRLDNSCPLWPFAQQRRRPHGGVPEPATRHVRGGVGLAPTPFRRAEGELLAGVVTELLDPHADQPDRPRRGLLVEQNH